MGNASGGVGRGGFRCTEVRINPFCSDVSTGTREMLCSSARHVSITKGSTVSAVSFSKEVLVVKSGVLAVALSTEKGGSQGLFVADSGCLINAMKIAGATRHFDEGFNDSHLGYALTDLRGCAIPLSLMRRAFEDDPAFARVVLSEITDRYRGALQNMALMAESSGVDRIVWLLDELERTGVGINGITHDLIGRLLCMNRVSVTRLMSKALERYGSAAR